MAEGAGAAAADTVLTEGSSYVSNLFDGASLMQDFDFGPDSYTAIRSLPGETENTNSLYDRSREFLSDSWKQATENYRDDKGNIDYEKVGYAAMGGAGGSGGNAEKYSQAEDMSQYGARQAKAFLAQAPQAPDAASELQKLRSMIQ